MEISCLPAGVAMPGQPVIAAGRLDGAAAFAILVESLPVDTQEEAVTAPVEEEADEVEETPELSLSYSSEGVAVPAKPIPDTVPDGESLVPVENVSDWPSTAPRQEHRPVKAAVPEVGTAVFAVIDEIVEN